MRRFIERIGSPPRCPALRGSSAHGKRFSVRTQVVPRGNRVRTECRGAFFYGPPRTGQCPETKRARVEGARGERTLSFHSSCALSFAGMYSLNHSFFSPARLADKRAPRPPSCQSPPPKACSLGFSKLKPAGNPPHLRSNLPSVSEALFNRA